MTVNLTSQLERMSYTRRDIDLIDDEVDKFIVHFLPIIKNTSKANVGRLFLRIIEGLIDKLNYSIDARFRQTVLRTVSELQSVLDTAELVRYVPSMVSAATTDLIVAAIGGVAGVGGIPIPQYQQFLSETAPVKPFIALESGSIPEGGLSTTVASIQGVRVVDQVILASATGEANEEILMPVTKTPKDYLEVKVAAVSWTRVVDFRDSEPEDLHFMVRLDEDLYLTVISGDGTYGSKFGVAAQVTSTYIQCLGEDGNTPRDKITGIVGSLAQTAYVTNPEIASGGSDGDAYYDVVRKAPRQASTFWIAGNDRGYESLAESLVDGVYRAIAEPGDGPLMNLYILPNGGGVASSALLTLTESTLAPREIHGMVMNALAIASAHIWIDMRVVLKTASVNKSIARKRIYESIAAFKLNGKVNATGALYYRNLTPGRGFTLSDIAGILENLDDGELVDYVDFLVFTRYPTVTKSRAGAPDFSGEIVPTATAGYDTWSIQAITTTTFNVYKNGVLDSNSPGTRGVEFTTAGTELVFTLAGTADTFIAGDSYAFKSSKYTDNMKLDKKESMELVRDSDLGITIYWPREYEIG